MKPENHTADCECPLCVPLSEWTLELPQDDRSYAISKTGDVRLVFSDGYSRPASSTDGKWPPLVGNALTRYQKERALLAAVTISAHRTDEARDALVEGPASPEYQRAWQAQIAAVAAMYACWRDLQAVGGPLP